jgi:signal transduction histidine kinase
MREQQVALQVEVPATLPDVRVDPMQVEQAIVEVVSNALDAMPAGGELRITARTAADVGTNGVTIEITDTGRGIPESALASVCEPFFTTRQEGTGLGLAIAKRYIEQNGGRLEISSRAGEGTSVRIWLPAAEPEAALAGSREG